nr:hypothetical protein [Tanacetum cinerariifolium]
EKRALPELISRTKMARVLEIADQVVLRNVH